MVSRLALVVLAVACAACSGKAPAPSDANKEPASERVAEPADDAHPKIEFGEFEIEGPRPGGELVAAATKNVESLRECYRKQLAKQPELAGELALRILIAPSGEVTDAMLHNNKLPTHRVGVCMLAAAKKWKLEANSDAEPTPVIIPMTLSP